MSSASLMVQRALVAALRADPGIADVVHGIFDGVAPEAVMPYVTIGAGIVTDWSHKTSTGREHRVAINVWDVSAGAARVQQLIARIEVAVATIGGVGEAHRIASTLFLRSFVIKDPDGATQGVVEFRIRTEAV